MSVRQIERELTWTGWLFSHSSLFLFVRAGMDLDLKNVGKERENGKGKDGERLKREREETLREYLIESVNNLPS